MTFEAIRLIERLMPASARVFEYGSGGSTLFFGRHSAQVVSVEHDSSWFEQVRAATAGFPNVELVLAQPRLPVDEAEAAVASSSPAFAGQTFVDYAAVVDRFPDHHFDLLVVDGRARPSCFFRAAPKVRIGGLVVLDDSERPAYASAVAAATAAGWPERGRYGPKLSTPWFSRTTVWTKTGDLGRH
jgi:beta-phosphoglucomutase-like phosphatase (HAD superfamily)